MIKHFIYSLTAMLLCCALASCVSELELATVNNGRAEHATVSVDISVSDMPLRMRGEDLDASEWNTIKDIYVAIYNVETGERVGYKLVSQFSNDLHTENGGKHTVQLEDIKFYETATYYIVGVANSQKAYGIYVNDGNSPTLENKEDGITFEANKEYRLSRLLECADTWEKYQRISSSVDPLYVDAAQFKENVVMAGSYSSGDSHAPAGLPQAVSIKKPTDNSIVATIEGGDGLIHLKRLVSHFDVNLIAGDGVTLTPTSWQVFNVPAVAFLQEREKIDFVDEIIDAATYYKKTPNAADIIEHMRQENTGTMYAKSLEGRFGNPDDESKYSFDFFQYENKHTGLSTECRNYNDREKEHKLNDADNSGVYQSLCPSPDATYNNQAGYFVIKTGIDYFENEKHYFGTAEYTIHLGYINENLLDFNCERNTRYTYNITVKGVDNIIVEAKKEGEEPQPGAEGDILTTEETTPIVNLDAHYGVFNVTFKKEDMTPTATLHWRMTCPYGNDVVTLEGKISKDNSNRNTKYDNSQFYNWVQFVPTKLGEVQSYPKDGKEGKANNNGMLYINDLTWEGNEDKTYTVFVDENVYEYEYDRDAAETGYTGKKFKSHYEYHRTWANYVNKANRRLTIWFTDEQHKEPEPNVYISSDKESIYTEFPSLVLSQKSIQTYYDTLDPTDTALGIEHYDEYSRDGTLDNNRYYTTKQVSSNGNMANDERGDARTWMYNTYNKDNKGWSDYLRNALVNSSSPEEENSDYLYDDKEPHYYLNSCLARNRDLNGNGKIDPEEIRWYMPQRSTFVRMFTGNIMLTSPIYDYVKNTEVLNNDGGTQAKYRYAMACGLQFYAYQAFSIGPINSAGTAPWQVRCIRDLGVSMEQTTNDKTNPYNYELEDDDLGIKDANGVEKAYSIDRENNIIDLSNYDRQALRVALDELKINRVSERSSQPALRFQYASDFCGESNMDENFKNDPDFIKNEDNPYFYLKIQKHNNSRNDYFQYYDGPANTWNESFWKVSVNHNSICKYYIEKNSDIDSKSDRGWRVPNICEAAILYDAGIISKDDIQWNTDGHLSSTIWGEGVDWVSKVMPKNPGEHYVTVNGESLRSTLVRCVRDID